MTPQQREAALRLADALRTWPAAFAPTGIMFETAALLRELAQEPMPEWPCKCDEQGIGDPGVTCGDCPRDYGHKVKKPVGEPVAWWCKWPDSKGGGGFLTCDKHAAENYMRNMVGMDGPVLVPLFAAPVHQAEPAQVPDVRRWTLLLVGEQNGLVGEYGHAFPSSPEYYERVNVYTAPPQRKPLSDEQILEAAGRLPGWLRHHEELDCDDLIDFARAIERAHGITGEPT